MLLFQTHRTNNFFKLTNNYCNKLVRESKHSQLAKYDINQKIVCELANLQSRIILFSIKRRSKLAEEISQESNIPISTVYLKLNNMKNLAMIFVERIELSDRGRRLRYFRSRIWEAEISFEKLKLKIVLVPNKNL